jgi:hypothetical protein
MDATPTTPAAWVPGSTAVDAAAMADEKPN